MSEIPKPDYRNIWASGGAIVAPSQSKQSVGWTAEVPPFQWENFLQNRQDTMLVHINQHGIPRWDALTEYFGGQSYTLGSDGQVYKAVINSSPATTTQDPVTDASDTYWRIAFADAEVNYLTQTTGDARYLQRGNNLSDITNAATARTNLGAAALSSPTFTGTPSAPTAALNTNSTQIATTGFLFNQFIGSGQQGLVANGYQKLPGGMIIQWGTSASINSGSATISFPVAFPNTCFSLAGNADFGTDSTSIYRPVMFHTITANNFLVRIALNGDSNASGQTEASPFTWIAIGW